MQALISRMRVNNGRETIAFVSLAIPLTVSYRGFVKCVSLGRFFRVNGKMVT